MIEWKQLNKIICVMCVFRDDNKWYNDDAVEHLIDRLEFIFVIFCCSIHTFLFYLIAIAFFFMVKEREKKK